VGPSTTRAEDSSVAARRDIAAVWVCVGRGLLGASPGSGPTLRGCPCSKVRDSGSRSFRSAQVSCSPMARGGGLCRQPGTGTPGSDPLPTADSVRTPAHPPPSPSGPQATRAVPSHDTGGTADAQHRSGCTHRGGRDLRGARYPVRGCAAAAASPSRSPGVLGPGNFPGAGRTLASRSAKPHPESSPASRRGGASASGLCPAPGNRVGWWGPRVGRGEGPPAPLRHPGQPDPLPGWASHDGTGCLPPAAISGGSPGPPGRIRPREGSRQTPAPQTPPSKPEVQTRRRVSSPPFVSSPCAEVAETSGAAEPDLRPPAPRARAEPAARIPAGTQPTAAPHSPAPRWSAGHRSPGWGRSPFHPRQPTFAPVCPPAPPVSKPLFSPTGSLLQTHSGTWPWSTHDETPQHPARSRALPVSFQHGSSPAEHEGRGRPFPFPPSHLPVHHFPAWMDLSHLRKSPSISSQAPSPTNPPEALPPQLLTVGSGGTAGLGQVCEDRGGCRGTRQGRKSRPQAPGSAGFRFSHAV